MAREQLKTLSEPMYYVLLALTKEQHGYAVMQNIKELTAGRVEVGAGTLYALLSRFEKEGIVTQTRELERRKLYCLSSMGAEILTKEYARLNQMVKDGSGFFHQDGSLPPIQRNEEREKEKAESVEAVGEAEGMCSEPPQEEPERNREHSPQTKGLRNGFGKGLVTT